MGDVKIVSTFAKGDVSNRLGDVRKVNRSQIVYFKFFLTFVVVLALILTSGGCIERDNPFDPINANRNQAQQIRDAASISLQKFIDSANSFEKMLMAYDSLRVQDSAKASLALAKVRAIESSNGAVFLGNAGIQVTNQSMTDPELWVFLSLWDTLPTLPTSSDYSGLTPMGLGIALLRASHLAHLDSVNRQNFPVTIFVESFRVATLSRYSDLERKRTELQTRVMLLADSMQQERLKGLTTNSAIQVQNLEWSRYNDSIVNARLIAKRPVITRLDSLNKKTQQLKPGDTLILGAGEFKGRIQISGSGTRQQPVLIQGQFGQKTILNGEQSESILFLSGMSHIQIRNLVFTGSATSGAKLEAGSQAILFENCDFIRNADHGLDVVDSDADIIDCRFIQNGKHGLFVSSSTTETLNLRLRNALIVHNGQRGIDGTSMSGEIGLATIADNATGGIRIAGRIGNLVMYSNLVAHNRGIGLDYPIPDGGRNLVAINNSFHENLPANFNLSVQNAAATSNLAMDPLFLNRNPNSTLDYRLGPQSALVELEKTGVRVGWRPR